MCVYVTCVCASAYMSLYIYVCLCLYVSVYVCLCACLLHRHAKLFCHTLWIVPICNYVQRLISFRPQSM